MTAPHRILIVLLGAIGDVTRALPLLCRLKAAYGDSSIYWAVEPPAAPLLAGHPALRGVVVFRRDRGAGEFPRFLREVRRLRPDLALDLQAHLKSGVVSLAAGASRRIGFARRNSREGNFLFQTERLEAMDPFSSKLEQFQRFGDYLGLPPLPVQFGLVAAADEEAAAERLLGEIPRPFAAMFVGSTAEARLWFPEPTARVIEALAERGVSTVLVGGPGEERFAEPIMRAARVPVYSLVGRTSLRELIPIFTRARLGIGPDCGPMHIAAAAGIPVVSWWGATSAGRSAPWGSAHLTVTGAAECMPCYRKSCPIGRLCMTAITPATVIAKVDEALAGAASAQDRLNA